MISPHYRNMKSAIHKIWMPPVIIALGLLTYFWAHYLYFTDSAVPASVESEVGVREVEPDALPHTQASPTRRAELVGNSENAREEYSPTNEDQNYSNAVNLDHRLELSNSIEMALAGSVDEASKVIERFHTCAGAPADEGGLRMTLQSHANNPELQMRIPKGIFGGFVQFDSLADWSVAETQRFKRCQATRNLFGEDLRAQLKAQGENGDVLARFIYAMLPPTNVERHPNRVLIWLEYVNLAYEFTTQNLDENEPLGLLAMGLGLRGVGEFTPHEPLVGDAFLIAAERCGAPQVLLDLIGIQYTDGTFRRSWADSEVIVREFCN